MKDPELHPEARSLLDRLRQLNARPLHELGVEGARKAVLGARALQGHMEAVGRVRDLELPGPEGNLTVRLYHPRDRRTGPMVVYVHGGGWVTGGLEEADGPCRALTNAWGCVVASVDYRLSPETPYPGAMHDVVAAVTWLADRREQLGAVPDSLVLVGESAGGTLATAACLSQAGNPLWQVDDLVLFYPPLAPQRSPDAPTEQKSTTLSTADMGWFWDLYLGSAPTDDPCAVPLAASSLATMPRTLMITAEADILRDEDIAMVRRLRAAGVQTTHIDVPGMVHGFLGMLGALPSARGVIEQVRPHLSSFGAPSDDIDPASVNRTYSVPTVGDVTNSSD